MSIVLFQIPQNYQNSGPMGGSAVMVNMGGNQQVGMTSGMFYRYRRFFSVRERFNCDRFPNSLFLNDLNKRQSSLTVSKDLANKSRLTLCIFEIVVVVVECNRETNIEHFLAF